MSKIIKNWLIAIIVMECVSLLITICLLLDSMTFHGLFIFTGFGGHAYWISAIISCISVYTVYKTKKRWMIFMPAVLLLIYTLLSFLFLFDVLSDVMGFLGAAFLWYLNLNIGISFVISMIFMIASTRKNILSQEFTGDAALKLLIASVVVLAVLDICSVFVIDRM